MENVYILIQEGGCWEDMYIFLSEEEAIAVSEKYKNSRVEIFKKAASGYKPSYNYYKNGKLVYGSENLHI